MYINYVIDQTESILENTNTYLDSVLEKRENEVVQEGVIGTIWEGIKMLFTAVIKAIVWLWKKLVSFVKLIVDGIKWLFGISSSSNIAPEHNKMITTTFSISMNDGKEVKKEVDNKKDLEKFHMENIRNISKVIDKLTKEEIETIENYEKMYGQELSKKESLTNITLEKVVYKSDFDRDDITNDELDMVRNLKSVNDDDKEYFEYLANKNNKTNAALGYKMTRGLGSNDVQSEEDKNFGLFDIKRAELILENENFIEAYRAYAREDYSAYIAQLRRAGSLYSDGVFMMDIIEKAIQENNLNVDQLRFDKLYGIDVEDEEKTKLLLQLRVNMNKSIIKLLQRILKNNKTILEIDKDALSILNKDLDIRELQMGTSRTIKALTKHIYENIDNYINGSMFDLRKFGMGIYLFSDKMPNDMLFKKSIVEDVNTFEQVVIYCIRWHINVLSHGIGYAQKEYFKDDPRHKKEYETMKSGEYNMQAVELPNGTFVTNVSDFLEWCKYSGRRMVKNPKVLRVNVISCNMDHIDIPPKFKKDRTMLISAARNMTTV